MKIQDLMIPDKLIEMIALRFVKVQDHPTEDLHIYNYTAQCAYAREWNEVTKQCRGLIIDGHDNVVARPFPKFFNYGEYDEAELDFEAPVEVTDKMDGSLGILYPINDGWAIATRGSFLSEQALWATKYLQDHYPNWHPYPGLTWLFEIIFKDNRIVLDYDFEGLVLLAAVKTESGVIVSPQDVIWPGPRTEVFQYSTLAEALAAEPRPNAEGLVVRYLRNDHMLKIKQEDYVALHRIVTNLNERMLWEILAVQDCAGLIKKRQHWGTYLGIDPERAEEILAMESAWDWLETIPDEFHTWVDQVVNGIQLNRAYEFDEALMFGDDASIITERKGRYEWLMDCPLSQYTNELLHYIDKGDTDRVKLRVWKEICPTPMKPFAVSEDVA